MALVHEGAECRRLDRFVKVGIFEHQQRRLAAKFEQARLQMLGRAFGDDFADAGRTREIDALYLRRINQRAHHFGGILRGVRHDIDDAFRETRLCKRLDDQHVRTRAGLAGFQDHAVAAGQRGRNGAHAQNDRRIPGGDAQNHAHRFLERHGDAARLVGGDHFASDMRRQRRRFAHDACGEAKIEHGPPRGGPGLVHHGGDKIVLARFQRRCGFHEHGTAGIGAHRRPCGKGGRGARSHCVRVRSLHGGRR